MPMRHVFRPLLRARNLPASVRWACAAGIVGIAFVIRYALYGTAPVIPYLFFLPAVIASAVVFDRRTGYVATVLSSVVIDYFFLPPAYGFVPQNSSDAINLAIYVGVCLFVTVVTESLHKAYVEAEQAHQGADLARRQAIEAHEAADAARRRAEAEHQEANAARQQAEAAERERALLLAELRHRVGNDLQRIAAMMHMQARRAVPEATVALQDAAARVMVIARVHDRLARQEGHVMVEMRPFLHDLVSDIRATITDLRPIGLFVDAEDHMLSIMRTGSVGLIANELVTNALKHAFPSEWVERGVEGRVTVGFRRQGDDYVLTVADNGIGLRDRTPSADRSAGQAKGGMGSQLVRALAAQLGGRAENAPPEGGGTVHTLRFAVVPPGDPEEAIVRADHLGLSFPVTAQLIASSS
jgi:two-component sensor histidine kinase